MMSHHFQGNLGGATHGTNPVGPPVPTDLLHVLQQAMEKEKATLGEAYEQLQLLMRDAAGMSLVEILKRLTGILVDAVLRSARVVVDAVFDLLILVMSAAIKALDTPVHIPVISDILNAIGVPDFSMLDALCWIVAVPVTIGYKLAMAASGKGHLAPFPDNAETEFLIKTKDFAALSAAFTQPVSHKPGPIPATASTPGRSLVAADGRITMSKTATEAVFISLHCASGVCGWVSAFVDGFESLTPTQLVSKPLNAACVASAIVGGVSRAAANVLVPKYPLTDELTRAWSIFFSGLFLLNKACWGYAGLTQTEADKRDYRAISAGLDTVLVIPALVITCLHFADLAKKDAGNERSIAILDETSFLATYVGRVLYTLVVTGALDSDEEVKIGVAAAMGVTSIVHGTLQFVEAAVEGVG